MFKLLKNGNTKKSGYPITKVAIVFYGLPRALEHTKHSIGRHIFNVLKKANIDYDTFVHHYVINGNYANPWSEEFTANFKNPDIKLALNPTYTLCDDQNEIIKELDFESYYTQKLDWYCDMPEEKTKYIIRNFVLALYSKYKITKLLEENKNEYSHVLFIRPDTLFHEPLDLTFFDEIHNNSMLVPNQDVYFGANDRIALCTIKVGLLYGTLYTSLLEYSQRNALHSEKYLYDIMKNNNITIIKRYWSYENLRINGFNHYHGLCNHRELHAKLPEEDLKNIPIDFFASMRTNLTIR